MTALALAALGAAALTAMVAFWLHRRATIRTARELALVRSELARRLSELFSLQELAYLLSESLQLDRIVTQVARYVTRFLDVEGSVVALTGDPGTPIRVVAAEGSLASAAGRHLSERDAGLIATAIGLEKLQTAEATAAGPLRIVGVDVQRAAAAPLRAHGVTVGALAVVNRAGGPFRDEDLRLLSTVATHAAIVLANARFFDLIRAGKEQWETTFDALAEGIAVVDANGRIRRANRAMAELLKQPLPALIGIDLAEALLGRTPETAKFFAVSAMGSAHPGITIESQPLGRIVRITAASLTGPESEGWVVALVEDVTDQKSMETQLIQNEKMVAVGQLVSGVAHELNNPLTSIHGLSEFLLELPGTPDRERDHLKVIQEQAERASRIVRNLLTFARKGPADLGDVDLNDIVQRTVLLMGYELKLREIQLETKLLPSLPAVRGDRYEIQQVVLNLLTNAVQAVADNPPERPPRIVLSTEQSGANAIVRVMDSGAGIAPEHTSQLFSPFFTTKQPGQGTGLGLSISFGIIERHGGKLSVERGGIGGASFAITLPLAGKGPAPATARRDSGQAPAAPRLAKTAEGALPQRVLLVDDDQAVRRMIRALFSHDDQKVETPGSAAEAVAQLEKGTFDLIIADARAAVSAGETFADVLLKRWPALRSKTILVTADVRPETHAWLKELGCSYFQKPFRIGELKEAAARIAASGASTSQ